MCVNSIRLYTVSMLLIDTIIGVYTTSVLWASVSVPSTLGRIYGASLQLFVFFIIFRIFEKKIVEFLFAVTDHRTQTNKSSGC